MRPLANAGQVMASTLARFASSHPELCDKSGTGFMPIPIMFPLLLTHLLDLLQLTISVLYSTNDLHVDKLVRIRMLFMQLMSEGDLGEDHTGLFLREHPEALKRLNMDMERGPFAAFCRRVRQTQDFAELCGIICRNEIGSEAEARALLEHAIISDGKYAQTHLVEEVEHANAAAEISEIFLHSPYRHRFQNGLLLHDRLYREVLETQP